MRQILFLPLCAAPGRRRVATARDYNLIQIRPHTRPHYAFYEFIPFIFVYQESYQFLFRNR